MCSIGIVLKQEDVSANCDPSPGLLLPAYFAILPEANLTVPLVLTSSGKHESI
jgi:hypothetical protein